MSEPIAKIKREKGYLYFLDADGDISRCPMAKGKKSFKHLKEKIARIGIKRESGYIYYIDKEGILQKTLSKKHTANLLGERSAVRFPDICPAGNGSYLSCLRIACRPCTAHLSGYPLFRTRGS